MQAYSIEQSIMEGKIEVNNLFEFVKMNVETLALVPYDYQRM